MTRESETYAALLQFSDEAAHAYDELTLMTPDEKQDRARVKYLSDLVDQAHILNARNHVPGYRVWNDGRNVTAPDGSTYGTTVIRRYTGSGSL